MRKFILMVLFVFVTSTAHAGIFWNGFNENDNDWLEFLENGWVTYVDPSETDISVDNDTCAFTSSDKDSKSYVYKDFGPGVLWYGIYQFNVYLYTASATGTPRAVVWGLRNNKHDLTQSGADVDDDGVTIDIRAVTNVPALQFINRENNRNEGITIANLSYQVWYVVRVNWTPDKMEMVVYQGSATTPYLGTVVGVAKLTSFPKHGFRYYVPYAGGGGTPTDTLFVTGYSSTHRYHPFLEFN